LRQVLPAFLKSPISSFFRVDADDGIACVPKVFALLIEMIELLMTLSRRSPPNFSTPRIDLRRILQLAQQFGDGRKTDGMPLRIQCCAQAL
jgi:hypothetical protein